MSDCFADAAPPSPLNYWILLEVSHKSLSPGLSTKVLRGPSAEKPGVRPPQLAIHISLLLTALNFLISCTFRTKGFLDSLNKP